MPLSDVKLFDDFSPSTASDWQAEIGRTLEKMGKPGLSLDWQLPDGILLPPSLTLDHLLKLPFTDDYPGAYPFTRSTSAHGQPWQAMYPVQKSGELTDLLAEAKRRGADGVSVFVGSQPHSVLYGKGYTANEVVAQIQNNQLSLQLIGETKELLQCMEPAPSANLASVSVLVDPYSDVLIQGDFAVGESDIYKRLRAGQSSYKHIAAVRGDLFQNAGASTALELALTLASAAEITTNLIDAGMSAIDALQSVMLFQPVGVLYFVEIAKFRATRRLSAMIAKGFGVNHYDSPVYDQSAVTSHFHLSMYDTYTNMLRQCTQAMSAVLGGAQSVLVLPLDSAFDRDDEFSRRMAINTQLILRNESYLDRVADPAGGSYYIEEATDQIAKAAWQIFLEIEEEGGYRASLEKGLVQKRLKQSGEDLLDRMARRKEIQIGVNQFPNQKEMLQDSAYSDTLPMQSEALPKDHDQKSQTKFQTVPMFRASSAFESLRLQTESYTKKKGERPFIQLLPFGSLAMQRARAAFIGNFFGCGGFEVNDPGSLDTFENCLHFAVELKQNKAKRIDAFVLCSADAEYLPAVESGIEQLKSLQVPVLVAGSPDADITAALKQKGIDDFIHLRRNVYQTLSDYQKRFCV